MPEPSRTPVGAERQIMDAVFALGEATVNQVVEGIPSPPTAMAVRRMMHILEEKGALSVGGENGRGKVVYAPRQAKSKAGRRWRSKRVLETFFGGSLEEALRRPSTIRRKDQVSAGERERLSCD